MAAQQASHTGPPDGRSSGRAHAAHSGAMMTATMASRVRAIGRASLATRLKAAGTRMFLAALAGPAARSGGWVGDVDAFPAAPEPLDVVELA